ncbi:MAG: hypothetical protein Q7K29_05615 [Thermoleophilia bacterium]|nr:hypothetical protein [Thermoleophilia bacterium]
MSDEKFREFFYEVKPIRLREPLAALLGAFEKDEEIVEFKYTDAVRAAGHACPTVSGAYLCCQEALDALYPDEVPLRGGLAITVYGSPDEGGLGVMSQVFTFITGAAPETGFKGLGGRFSRKDLMRFEAAEPACEEPCFRFQRLDTGAAVRVSFYPWLIPFPEESGKRLAALMGPVVSGEASDEEGREFQKLWLEKIRGMVIDRNDIETWLKVEAA